MEVRLVCNGQERWARFAAGDVIGRVPFGCRDEAVAGRISREAVKIVALTATRVAIQRVGASPVYVDLPPAPRAVARGETVDLPRFAGVVLSLAKGTARIHLDVAAPAAAAEAVPVEAAPAVASPVAAAPAPAAVRADAAPAEAARAPAAAARADDAPADGSPAKRAKLDLDASEASPPRGAAASNAGGFAGATLVDGLIDVVVDEDDEEGGMGVAALEEDGHEVTGRGDDVAMARTTAATPQRPPAASTRRTGAAPASRTPQRDSRLDASDDRVPAAARSGSRERGTPVSAAADDGGDCHVGGVKRKHRDISGNGDGAASATSPPRPAAAAPGSGAAGQRSPCGRGATGAGSSPSLPLVAPERVSPGSAAALSAHAPRRPSPAAALAGGGGKRSPGQAPVAAASARSGTDASAGRVAAAPSAAAPAAASGPLSGLAFALVDATDGECRVWTRTTRRLGGIILQNTWVRPCDVEAAQAIAEAALIKKKPCSAFQTAQAIQQFAALCEQLTAVLGARQLVTVCKTTHSLESLIKWFGSALLPFDACHFEGPVLSDEAAEALDAVNAHEAMQALSPIQPVFAQYRSDQWLQDTFKRCEVAGASSSGGRREFAAPSDIAGVWHPGVIERARASLLRSLSVIESPPIGGAQVEKTTASAAPSTADAEALPPAAAAAAATPPATRLTPPAAVAACITAARKHASLLPHSMLSVTARGVDLEDDDHPFADVYDRMLYDVATGEKDESLAFSKVLQPLIDSEREVAVSAADVMEVPVPPSGVPDADDWSATAAPLRGSGRGLSLHGGAAASIVASRRPYPYMHVYDTSTLPLAPSGLPLPLRPLGEYLRVEGVDAEGTGVLRPSEDDYRTIVEHWADEPARVEALRRGFGMRAAGVAGTVADFGSIQPTGCPFTLDELTSAAKPVASVAVLRKGLPARKILMRHPCLVLVLPGASEAQRALGGADSDAGSSSDTDDESEPSDSETSAAATKAGGHGDGSARAAAVGGAGASSTAAAAAGRSSITSTSASSSGSTAAASSRRGDAVPPLVCPYGIIRRRNVNSHLTQPLLSRLQLYEDNKGADEQSDFKGKQLKVALGVIGCVERPLESLSDLKLLRPWLMFSSNETDRNNGSLTGDKVYNLLQKYRNGGRKMPPNDCEFDVWQLAKRDLQSIHGIGAKKVQSLLQLGLRSVADVQAALNNPHHGRHAVVRAEFGSGEMRKSLMYHEAMKQRISRKECEACLAHVREVADGIAPGSIIHLVGSYRRGKPTSGDIDMLLAPPDDKTVRDFYVALVEALARTGFLIDCFRDDFAADPANRTKLTPDPTQMFQGFCRLPTSGSAASSSSASSSASSAAAGIAGPARRIDMKFTKRSFWPTALLTWTGNALFNRILREFSAGLGWDIGHSGIRTAGSSDVERLEDGRNCRTLEVKVVPVNTEVDVFSFFGLQYIPPHQRNYCDAVLSTDSGVGTGRSGGDTAAVA